MKKWQRVTVAIGAVAVLPLGFVACSGDSDAAAAGELFIIGPPANAMDLIIADFEEEYGVDVTYTSITVPTEMYARIDAEQGANKYLHDVFLSTQCSVQENAKWLDTEPADLENIADVIEPYSAAIEDAPYSVPWQVGNYALLVNTDLVPDGSITSWNDINDDRWSGEITRNALTLAGGGQAFFEASYPALGEEFHEKLAAQDAAVNTRYEAAARQVVQGEYAMYFPFLITYAPDFEGLPVKVVIPEEGAPSALYAAAKMKNAPNPENADLFLNFLLSDEAQKHVVDTVHKGVTGSSELLLDGEPVTDMGRSTCGEVRDELKTAAEEIYGAGN